MNTDSENNVGATSGRERVSVIVPVHNSMPHLERCAGSIISQTRPADEIVFVDDGSTDSSAEYLHGIAARHPHIRVISQPCRGVSAARNRGIEESTGDYILFVDADDFVSPALIEETSAYAAAHAAQMTIFGFDEYYAEFDAFLPREMYERGEFENRTFALSELPEPSTYLVTPNVWRIMFERRFLNENNLRFHEDLSTSEDLALIYEALFSAQRIALLNKRFYHYRRDGGSTLTRKARSNAGSRALACVKRVAQEKGVLEPNAAHFVNIVLDVAEYAMSTSYDCREYAMLFDDFEQTWLPSIAAQEHLVHERYRPFYDHVKNGSLPYLFYLFEKERAQLEHMRALNESNARRADIAEQEAADVRNSHSYRFGNAFMRIPSAIKKALRHPR